MTMVTPEKAEELAKKHITLLLTECGAASAADAEKILNKLVAVAAQSVEYVVDQDAAIKMLDGIRVYSMSRQQMMVSVMTPHMPVIMAAPTALQ